MWFVQFVDRFLGSIRAIHETHEMTRKVLKSTFEAKPIIYLIETVIV